MYRIISFSFALIIYSSLIAAQDLTQRLDDLMRGKIDRPFIYVVLVSQGDKLIYERSFGTFGNPSKNSQVTIGSITKQFTATIVLRLVDQGLIDLDIPINSYLPELTDSWADKITTRHLLNHTSGIKAIGEPLEFEPGTKAKYSRFTTYVIAAKIAERVSNKSFKALISELAQLSGIKLGLVFHPPLMKVAGVRAKYPNLVRGFKDYSLNEEDKRLREVTRVLTFSKEFVPASGIIASVAALHEWQRQLHKGNLLSKQSYQEMITPYGKLHDYTYKFMDSGLGTFMVTRNGVQEIFQRGYSKDIGHLAGISYFPKYDVTITTVSNLCRNAKEPERIFVHHNAIKDLVLQHFQGTSP